MTTRLHYAWIVAISGALTTFCCLGLARFAFGMLLPSMSEALSLDYSQRGMLGSSYLIGYVAMVAAVPFVAPRLGQRTLITGSLSLISLSLFGVSLSDDFLTLCLIYGLTGIGSGGAFVPVMSLASAWFHPSHRGLAAGIHLAGAGLGIIISGFVVPRLEPMFGLAQWQLGWLIFAIFSAFTAAWAFTFIRNAPADVGTSLYGRPPAPKSQAHANKVPQSKAILIAHLGSIYAVYGATYMIYASFIVTSMVDAYGMTQAQAGQAWAWVGIVSMFSGTLFGWLSDKIGRKGGFIAALSVLATAYILASNSDWTFALYPSLILYGLAAWSIPTIIAAASGDYFGPKHAASGLAAVTLTFAIGQTLGPVGAGYLAEATGAFGTSYAAASAAAILAILLCLLLKPPR
ncbi:MAG: YbfB/YjiJ family MFS transporter [Pikeienuella sp.]